MYLNYLHISLIGKLYFSNFGIGISFIFQNNLHTETDYKSMLCCEEVILIFILLEFRQIWARGTKALPFEPSLDTFHANLHIFHARENAFF